MYIKDYLYIAWKQIRKEPVETFLIQVGIALCIVAVSSSYSLIESYRQFNTLGNNMIFSIGIQQDSSFDKPLRLYAKKVKEDVFLTYQDYIKLKNSNIKGVEAVWVSKIAYLFLSVNEYRTDQEFPVYFVTPEAQRGYDLRLSEGDFILQADVEKKNKVAVIGTKLAETLFAEQNPVGKKIGIFNDQYQIIGVVKTETREDYSSNASSILNESIFMPYYNLHLYSESEMPIDTVSSISVKGLPEADVIEFKNELLNHCKQLLQKPILIQGEYLGLLSMRRTIKLTVILLSFFSSCIFVVVALNIFNLLSIRFQKRYKSICMLKVLGSSQKEIILLYMMEVILLSLMGSLLGIILTQGVLQMYQQFGFTPRLSGGNIMTGIMTSLCIGILLGIYPSLKVAKTNLIDYIKES